MTFLKFNGKLKSSTDDFNKIFFQLINYEPTLNITSDLKVNCYIDIDSDNDYDIIDVISVLVRHCSNFKMEVERK